MSKNMPHNTLCRKCLRHCKQPAEATLIDCPRFYPLPFRVEKHKYQQLGLFKDETSAS